MAPAGTTLRTAGVVSVEKRHGSAAPGVPAAGSAVAPSGSMLLILFIKGLIHTSNVKISRSCVNFNTHVCLQPESSMVEWFQGSTRGTGSTPKACPRSGGAAQSSGGLGIAEVLAQGLRDHAGRSSRANRPPRLGRPTHLRGGRHCARYDTGQTVGRVPRPTEWIYVSAAMAVRRLQASLNRDRDLAKLAQGTN